MYNSGLAQLLSLIKLISDLDFKSTMFSLLLCKEEDDLDLQVCEGKYFSSYGHTVQ